MIALLDFLKSIVVGWLAVLLFVGIPAAALYAIGGLTGLFFLPLAILGNIGITALGEAIRDDGGSK